MSDQDKHITPEQFEKYLNGELSPEESHAVEAAMQSHPLYDEAMDGFEAACEQADQTALSQDLKALSQKISLPDNNTQTDKPQTPWLRIAAAVLILLVALPALWLLVEKGPLSNGSTESSRKETPEEQPVAMQTPEQAPESEEGPGQEIQESADLADSDQKNGSGSSAGIAEKQPAANRSDTPLAISAPSPSRAKRTQSPAPAAEKPEEDIHIDTYIDEEVTEEFIMDEGDMIAAEAEVEASRKTAEAETAASRKASEAKSIMRQRKKEATTLRGALVPTDSGQLTMEDFAGATQSSPLPTIEGDTDKVSAPFTIFPTPKPVGGNDAFLGYLMENGVTTVKQKKQKPVTLSFKVAQDSTLQNIVLEKGDSVKGALVKSLLENGPKWIPDSDTTKNQLLKKFWSIQKKN